MNSYDNYKDELNEILSLTVKPMPPKKALKSKPLSKSTSVNLAVDIIIKYLTYFLNPSRSTSQDTTITKDGTTIRIARDPLEFIINSNRKSLLIGSINHQPKDWLNMKFYWIEFITVEIIEKIIQKKTEEITLTSLKHMLVDLFLCKTEIENAVNDLHHILKNISLNNFQNSHNVINPSFHHVYEKSKHFLTQADLIIDTTLVDIKNTKELIFSNDNFRQLLYYYFWTTLEIDERYFRLNLKGSCYGYSLESEIYYLGIYYSRFDYLFRFDVRNIWKNKNDLLKAKNIFYNGIMKMS